MSSVDNKKINTNLNENLDVFFCKWFSPLLTIRYVTHSVRKKNSLNSVPSVDNKKINTNLNENLNTFFCKSLPPLLHPGCYDTL